MGCERMELGRVFWRCRGELPAFIVTDNQASLRHCYLDSDLPSAVRAVLPLRHGGASL